MAAWKVEHAKYQHWNKYTTNNNTTIGGFHFHHINFVMCYLHFSNMTFG